MVNKDERIKAHGRRKSVIKLCQTFGVLVLCWGVLFACSLGAVLACDAIMIKVFK